MTTRQDVNVLVASANEMTALARADLTSVFQDIGAGDPKMVRDVLLQVYPEIALTYSPAVAASYAEWYEVQRSEQVSAGMRVLASGAPNRTAMQETVRYAVKFLFEEDLTSAFSVLNNSIQRYVTEGGRGTIADNLRRDRANPRWGRVPRGAKTCAFCLIMASRGFTYSSARAAGEGNEYHNDCNCQPVPEWEQGAAQVDGYDPDGMTALYRQARIAAGSGDIHEIAAQLRRLNPDALTDGHVPT